ncbi:MAG: A24 family peptidase [Rhizomicrobium sp.]
MTVPPLTWIVLAASPFVGSFLAVVALRFPHWRGLLFGRSACDSCGRTLSPLELVPIASFFILRGRCRSCSAAVDPLHPAMEVGALAVAASAALVTSGWILVASCGLGWMLLALAAIDWRTGLLPDVLTYPLIAVGIWVAYAIDPASVAGHAIGAAAGVIFFAAVALGYRMLRGRDGLGFGDAKLLGAAGAWLSWEALPTVVLFAAVTGLATVLGARALGRTVNPTDRIAFGPALAAAIWLVWLLGPLVPG